MRGRVLRIAACLLAIALCMRHAWAESGPTILRDAEIENDLRTMAAPIFRAAGLVPKDVAIYLVQDSQINSFVVGGQAIFINTGLILRAKTPNQLIGVIAHETGHIAGGHVVRTKEALHNAQVESIIAMAVALGASVAGRSSAPMLGAAGVGERSFLRFSVAQEATADHAALTYLDRSGQSARGLLKFFEIMQTEEMLSGDRQEPWVRTHPFSQQRAEYVRRHVESSRYSDAPDPPGSAELLDMVQLKIRAFLDPPGTTLANYPESDRSLKARYARAIANYRIPKLDIALPLVDGLIRDYPDNPYFRELKGQMLFENGRIREAMQPYEQAVKMAPNEPLLRISLSQAYIESGEASLNKRAIAYLNDASRAEGKESQVWHFLAVAYGRDNQFGMAALSLAEEALALGKKKDALQQSNRAKQLLPKNGAGWMRADDINHEAQHLDD